MSAPKIPLSILRAVLAISVLKNSNKAIAFSGFAALINEGRFPFL